MSQLFKPRSDGPVKQGLEQELKKLEQQARAASPGYETQFLNRAGNLCAEAGMVGRALEFYGRAIDAYLESGRFSAAEVLCTKVLRLAPLAVRPRCTLAWLTIGKGWAAGGGQEIGHYVEAARFAGREQLAGKHLAMMAEATANIELRELIGQHLLDLGEFDASEKVLAAVYEERSGLRPARMEDESKLWAQLLKAALMSPEDMNSDESSQTFDEALPSFGD